MSRMKVLGWLLVLALPGLAALAETPPVAPPEPVPVAEPARAWLGAWLGDAVDGGVQVVALVSRGPADRAGLRRGDVIVELDERPVLDQELLGRLLSAKEPGDEVALSVLRSGDVARIALTLGERVPQPAPMVVPRAPRTTPPVPAARVTTHDRLQSSGWHLLDGLVVAEITPALREHYGAPPDRGVLVLGVAAREATDEVGLRVGDVLVQIGEQEIRNRRQLERTLATWRSERPPEARILRNGQPRSILISLSAQPTPAPEPDREILRQRIRLEIERLERRLDELREQLSALSSAG